MSGRCRVPADDYRYPGMCRSSKGVLINTKGEIVGVIKKNIREDVNVIQAFSIAQLRPRIEQMINKQAPRYLGIYGVSIPAAKAASLGISKGIYIEKVAQGFTGYGGWYPAR